MSGETLEPPNQHGREKFQYRAWYEDPEQVENLVAFLEAKTKTVETDPSKKTDAPSYREQWKYGAKNIFQELFPLVASEFEKVYSKAPTPATAESFAATISQLKVGVKQFGSEIPEELQRRFLSAMEQRGQMGLTDLEERIRFWTKDKKLVAAGLMDFCSLTAPQINQLFEQKLETRERKGLDSVISNWRRNKEFPFESRLELPLNQKQVITFVEELRLVLGMTLQDVKEWLIENEPERKEGVRGSWRHIDSQLRYIDRFISRYEQFRTDQKK